MISAAQLKSGTCSTYLQRGLLWSGCSFRKGERFCGLVVVLFDVVLLLSGT